MQIRLQKRGHAAYAFTIENNGHPVAVGSPYPNKLSALTEIDAMLKGLFGHLVSLTDNASPATQTVIRTLAGMTSGLMAVKLRQMILVDETGEP